MPCLPAHWQGFKLRYRYFDTVYRIAVLRAGGKSGVTVDGVEQQDPVIPLFDDRREHSVEVRL